MCFDNPRRREYAGHQARMHSFIQVDKYIWIDSHSCMNSCYTPQTECESKITHFTAPEITGQYLVFVYNQYT